MGTMRKLAEQSFIPIDTSPYFGRLVQSLIDDGKSYYLRHLYFNYQYMSFLPPILEQIGVPAMYRGKNTIPKPGFDHEAWVKTEFELLVGTSYRLTTHQLHDLRRIERCNAPLLAYLGRPARSYSGRQKMAERR